MSHWDTDGVLIDVGRKIEGLRKRAHMTHAELAKRLSVRKEVVIKIEKGQYDMLLETLIEIARIFGRRLSIRFVKRKEGI
jgi:DNA-binding XRE family transcriptional regulator